MGKIDPNRILDVANRTLEKVLSKSSTEPLSLEPLPNASLTEAPVEGSCVHLGRCRVSADVMSSAVSVRGRGLGLLAL